MAPAGLPEFPQRGKGFSMGYPESASNSCMKKRRKRANSWGDGWASRITLAGLGIFDQVLNLGSIPTKKAIGVPLNFDFIKG
jgi:hypothetical protein